jgi:hypothetical protein
VSRVRITFDERGEVVEYELRPSAQECERGLKALMLAPTPAIYEALLAGERVPIGRLNPEWVRRYGLRT